MRYLLTFFVLILVSSCHPRLYYLGDTYSPTTQVDVYYSPNDIALEYKVIGQLTGENQGVVDLDEIKIAMIEETKQRGADGILFVVVDSYDNDYVVKADLIRYTKWLSKQFCHRDRNLLQTQ